MSKDGTNRGGGRAGSGKKQNSKLQRILDGAAVRSLDPYNLEESEIPEGIPDLPSWATCKQHGKIDCGGGLSIDTPALRTKEIFSYIWSFLDGLGVVQFISMGLIQMYSLCAARYIQCEEIISLSGLTAAHPTTGAMIASPFVTASQNYLKSANSLWFQISQIVKDNWEGNSGYGSYGNDRMEYLLTHNPKEKD